MTILEMLNEKCENNQLMKKALEVIKDNFTNLVNDNYELVIDERGELNIKIPSLEKRNEYVYKNIGEYQYPLVMCMRITEINNVLKKNEVHEYIAAKFLELYKEKLELFVKDVTTVDKLLDKVKRTKKNIDYITYASVFMLIICLLSLCISTNVYPAVRSLSILGMVLFSAASLIGQLLKESQVKKVIDAYLSVIKTEWYKNQLIKEYSFIFNFMG